MRRSFVCSVQYAEKGRRGVQHLQLLTSVVYVSKSCNLLGHGRTETETERSDVVCVVILSSWPTEGMRK